MYDWARPGVKCVCIAPRFAWRQIAIFDKRFWRGLFRRDPYYNEICTITAVRMISGTDIVGFHLAGFYAIYSARSFRPIVTTDISALQAIVAKVFDRKRTGADA